jgi:hypothetical protein
MKANFFLFLNTKPVLPISTRYMIIFIHICLFTHIITIIFIHICLFTHNYNNFYTLCLFTHLITILFIHICLFTHIITIIFCFPTKTLKSFFGLLLHNCSLRPVTAHSSCQTVIRFGLF